MSSQIFSSCTLYPYQKDGGDDSSPLNVTQSPDGAWRTASFYQDSSGRSSVSVPLELRFQSKSELDSFLEMKCIHPPPSATPGVRGDGEPKAPQATAPGSSPTSDDVSLVSFGIEAKVTLTFGTGEAIAASVEGVNILSSRVSNHSVVFDTEIIVRVSRAEGGRIDSGEASRVKTDLEVAAVLSEKVPSAQRDTIASKTLKALNLGGFPDLGGGATTASSNRRVLQTRLTPFRLRVSLTHAFSIYVRSVAGPSMGQNLVSLTMRHSNTHSDPVTITKIAFHPGHSRVHRSSDLNPAALHDGAEDVVVVDMSKPTQWGYAAKSDPNLPLTLRPNEAFSTVIVVEATDDVRCRKFLSPISVTGLVGEKDKATGHRDSVVAAADFSWMTSRAAVVPSDAFRVEMSLEKAELTVGSVCMVSAEISNLSSQERDLVLVLDSDKNAENGNSDPQTYCTTEINGQKFSIQGLDDLEKPPIDQELLAVDGRIRIGSLKGNAATHVGVRFIPLRAGMIRVPHFDLVDKGSGKVYRCIHNLSIVAQNPEE